jgi:hypothetical protein
MAFAFGDHHIDEYHTQGFTVFRDLIPPRLLADLRRQADIGRPIARRVAGGNAQRLQPLVQHPEIDMAPFDALDRLPVLCDALRDLFASQPDMVPDLALAREWVGILYEPGESPYCMSWHRDYRDLHPGVDLQKWQSLLHDQRMFNQTNVALYDDGCLWAVPGSHLRRDTPQEIRRFPDRPIPHPDVTGLDPGQAELVCREYVQSMPGAVQVRLNAGDFMLYRNTLWHTGNYVPYIKRATIHGALLTPEYKAYYLHDFLPVFDPANGKQRWQNANADTATFREVYARMLAQRWWGRAQRLPGWLALRIKRRLGF